MVKVRLYPFESIDTLLTRDKPSGQGCVTLELVITRGITELHLKNHQQAH